METTTENAQENLFPENGTGQGVNGVLRMRECDHCGKSYAFKNGKSKFCSLKCKNKARPLAGMGSGQTPEQSAVVPAPGAAAPVATSTPAPSLISSAAFKDQPMHVQLAMDLLKERMEEWKAKVCELQAEVKALTKERDEMKAQLVDKDHALNGLEEARPSMFERVLGAIPAPWIEALAGPIATLANKVNAGGGPMAGVNGQLDAQAQTYLQEINAWYAALPADLQGKVYSVLVGVAKGQEPVKMDEILTRITNLLNNDNPFEQQQASAYGGNVPSMFATVNGVH